MKVLFLVFVSLLAACNDANQTLVREHLNQSMKINESNLEIQNIELGEKIQTKPEQQQNIALLGLKDVSGFPLTVTFKAKAQCVAIAEAVKNDVLFGEKKVSCRSVKDGEQPDLKYVSSYKIVGFGKQVPVYQEGYLVKAGETFSARGELVFMKNLKDEEKSGTIFQGLK